MMVESWFIHTSKNPASRAKRNEVRGSGAAKRTKTTKISRRARERKKERGRKTYGRGKEAEQKLRCIVAIGFLLYPRLRTTDRENFIFVHFSSLNQFQKLDYFSPSQSFAVHGRSRGLLRSLIHIHLYIDSCNLTLRLSCDRERESHKYASRRYRLQ